MSNITISTAFYILFSFYFLDSEDFGWCFWMAKKQYKEVCGEGSGSGVQ